MSVPAGKAVASYLCRPPVGSRLPPRRIHLGEVGLPADVGLEDAEAITKKAFPAANSAQFFEADGRWWASVDL